MVGKLIVATDEAELGRLNDLYDARSAKRHRPVSSFSMRAKSKIANRTAVGIRAIFSPVTGIVDWGRVSRDSYAERRARQPAPICISVMK